MFSTYFKRRKLTWIDDFEAIKGPFGYIRDDGTKIGVVVDIKTTKVQRRTERLLGPDSKYTLTNDGEYLFRLDFTANNLALALIGLRSKGQRE